METQNFEELKRSIRSSLTVEQCVELEALVRQALSDRTAETLTARQELAVVIQRCCPRCGGTAVVRDGYDGDRPRFRCRKTPLGGCGRRFNAFTGTPLARMRKPELWLAYARLMAEGKSIDEIHEAGIGIARLTAFRWRHRLLKLPAATESRRLEGVVEADETFFRSSFKGSRGWKNGNPPENRPPRYRGGPALKRGLSGEQVPVLTALDRAGGVIERVLKPPRNEAEIIAALDGRIAPGSVVCSDGLKAYVKVAVKAGSEHRRVHQPKPGAGKLIGAKPRKKGRLGLGRVNSHHERLKTFINRQRYGVSTRYLANYLGWQRMARLGAAPEALLEAATTKPTT